MEEGSERIEMTVDGNTWKKKTYCEASNNGKKLLKVKFLRLSLKKSMDTKVFLSVVLGMYPLRLYQVFQSLFKLHNLAFTALRC